MNLNAPCMHYFYPLRPVANEHTLNLNTDTERQTTRKESWMVGAEEVKLVTGECALL